MVSLKLIPAIHKVFADTDRDALAPLEGVQRALKGETFMFEALVLADRDVKVSLRVPEGCEGSMGLVRDVPVEMTAYPQTRDDDYLRREPGLYPDLIVPLEDPFTVPACEKGCVLWLECAVSEGAEAGTFPVEVGLTDGEGDVLAGEGFFLEILPAVLPEQSLIYTQWFHCDCLSSWYCVDPLSDMHWELIERYAAFAAAHGVNMLYMPVFTPALDTEVGGERPTVQLVGVTKDGDDYLFDFSLVGRWLDMCSRIGIRYHEIAHLFTQWGAEHAPKVMAFENGRMTRIFGWETDSLSDGYIRFLKAFLRAFRGYMEDRGLLDRCMFHLSDEPDTAHLARYRRIRELLAEELSGLNCGEALSDPGFCGDGSVQTPIAPLNRIGPFLEKGIRPLWAYHCCGQHEEVSNRFVAMSMNRTRVIGMQLFKYGISGFLQWGYDFWYAMGSTHMIDPYHTLDGGGRVPAGDPFSVYPGPDGRPYASLRLKAFAQALQDLRAMEWLSERIGKEAITAILEAEGEVTFSRYGRDAGFCERTRDRLNTAVRIATREAVDA